MKITNYKFQKQSTESFELHQEIDINYIKEEPNSAENELKVTCEICGKNFVNLKRHMATHTKRKKNKCPRKYARKRQKVSQNGEIIEEPFVQKSHYICGTEQFSQVLFRFKPDSKVFNPRMNNLFRN